MSKVYILFDDIGLWSKVKETKGVISSYELAEKWQNMKWPRHSYEEIELDDPELLNRIAKEGK